jgi:hypothetical protein
MGVSGEFDVPVEGVLIYKMEQFTSRHGNHLFSSGETTIVPHDPTNKASAQEHVCSLNQRHLSPLLKGGDRGSTA